MFPPAGNCRGCRQRDREIQFLHECIERIDSDNTRLQRRCARLKKDNQRLRSQLEEARRQPRRQAGAFRRDQLKKRRKKPGRRQGHPAELRPTPTPTQIDRVIDVPLRLCPTCNVELVEPKIHVQFQTDLPPIVPIVTQFNIESGFCPCCRQRHQGRHAEQISDALGAAGNTLGPVVLTMAAELKHRLGVPYRKIADFLQTYGNLHVASATLVRAEKRLAELAKPTYDLLIDALRRCHIVHADETGWRVGALNAWLWVFTNKDVTIYTIRTGEGARGHEVPEEILGPDFDGWLIVDGFSAYSVLEYAKGQCNAHLVRRGKELSEAAESKEKPFFDELVAMLQKALSLAERRAELTVAGYARQVNAIEARLDTWLLSVSRRRDPSPELDRLANHVANHYDEWLVFLHDPEVPATNNHAERMLRPAVITRKVGGCNKTLLGALVHSVLSSIMVTCQQQGEKFLNLARQLWQGGKPQAIPIVPEPPPRVASP